MKYWFSIGLMFFSALPLRAASTNVQAVDAASGLPVPVEKVVLSPRMESRFFVDTKNLRIELGPGASAYFEENGNFHLLRGAAILESSERRTVRTVNGLLQFNGKLILSYDFREQSSSAFVVFGNAVLENSANSNSQRTLARHQGATLVTGEFYPSVIRNLDFTMADTWLKRYGWAKEKRAELLAGVPSQQEIAKSSANSPELKSDAKRELASYFPVAQNEVGPRKYEKEYTASGLRGQEHTALEDQLTKGEEIEIITPEQAAVIVLPDIGLGPGIQLSVAREEKWKGRTNEHRAPASLSRVKEFKPAEKPRLAASTKAAPAPEIDPAVGSALDRLTQVENSLASEGTTSKEERQWSDLQENF